MSETVQNYLCNRKQYVQYNNGNYSTQFIEKSAPGINLDHTLFLICINDITGASGKFHCTLYTDATTLRLTLLSKKIT